MADTFERRAWKEEWWRYSIPATSWGQFLYLYASIKPLILFRFLTKQKFSRFALDYGCGIGQWAMLLARFLGLHVVGIDISKEAIALGKMNKRRSQSINCEFIVADGRFLPFRLECFDIVYSSDVFGHISNLQKGINEIALVLKQGGYAAVFSETSMLSSFGNKLVKLLGLNPWIQRHGHISLYSFPALVHMLEKAGLVVREYKFIPDLYGILVKNWDKTLDEMFPKLRKHFILHRIWGKAVQAAMSTPFLKYFFHLLYASMFYLLISFSHEDKGGVFFYLQRVARLSMLTSSPFW